MKFGKVSAVWCHWGAPRQLSASYLRVPEWFTASEQWRQSYVIFTNRRMSLWIKIFFVFPWQNGRQECMMQKLAYWVMTQRFPGCIIRKLSTRTRVPIKKETFIQCRDLKPTRMLKKTKFLPALGAKPGIPGPWPGTLSTLGRFTHGYK